MDERLGFPWFSALLTWPAIALMLVLYGAHVSGILEGGDRPVDAATYGLASPADPGELSQADRAELDDGADLPGTFVPSQGRQHSGSYPLAIRIEFCEGEPAFDECYASNPPSSGRHIGVQADVTLEDGHEIDLPPAPGIYDFAVPRESIPHIQEHAGVYLGYNCETSNCRAAVRQAQGIVEQELERGGRIVMSPDPDLDPDTLGLASWTRVDVFDVASFEEDRVLDFIRAHSCRFDPEGFCDAPATN